MSETVTVAEPTRQDIFNKVWQAFVVEKAPPSVRGKQGDEPATCLYRGPNGEKCGVGVLLPDFDWLPSLNSLPVRRLVWTRGEEVRPYIGSDDQFLSALQHCHDDAALTDERRAPIARFGKKIESNLRLFAASHSLTIPAAEGA